MQGEALLDIRKRPSRLEKGVSFNSRIQLPLFPLTILSHPTNSIHAPLHSERGRGGGSIWALGEAGWGNLKPITPLEETNLLEFFLHTCFLFIGHVLEGNTVRSEVETEQFHNALTTYDVTTEVTDNIDHCL